MKKVLIMMAVYNGEKYIREQINSICKQSYTNWRLLISDDGSNDKSISIIESFIEEYKSKITLIHNTSDNHGAKNNFAYVFAKAEAADYYMFADQDDIWMEEKIFKFVDTMKKNEGNTKKPLLVFSDMEVVNSRLEVIDSSFYDYTGIKIYKKNRLNHLLYSNYIPGCVMMFNYSLKEKIGKNIEKAQIHDWWVTLVAECFGKIVYIDGTYNKYRQHENNVYGAIKSTNEIKQCIEISRHKYVIKEIMILRDNRKNVNIQTKEFLKIYGKELDKDSLIVIENFIKILNKRNPITRMILAYFNKFTVGNYIYDTIFYLV